MAIQNTSLNKRLMTASRIAMIGALASSACVGAGALASDSDSLWIGSARTRVDRYDADPCSDRNASPLKKDVSFSTWTRERATVAAICFEVYQQGVTDWDNADAWKALDVRVHYRYLPRHLSPGSPDAFFKEEFVGRVDRSGNNIRYAINLRSFDPYTPVVYNPDSGFTCPRAPFTVENDYAVSRMEFYFTVNGKELKSADGSPFVARFEDYAGMYSHCKQQ